MVRHYHVCDSLLALPSTRPICVILCSQQQDLHIMEIALSREFLKNITEQIF